MIDTHYPDLINLFESGEKAELLAALDPFFEPTERFPYSDLLIIYNGAEDTDTRDVIANLFSERFSELEDWLKDSFNSTSQPNSIRRLVVMIVCQHIRPSTITFLLDCYYRAPEFRQYILTTAFTDSELLLLSLATYIQDRELDATDTELTLSLLETVPQDIYTLNAQDLRHLKISDLYYLVDPVKRKRIRQVERHH